MTTGNNKRKIPTVEDIMEILARISQRLDRMEVQREVDNDAYKKRQEAADKRQEAADKRQEAADKRQEAADKQMQEVRKQMQKTRAELRAVGEFVRELGKQIGGVGNQWGDIAEYLVVGDFSNIIEKHFGFAIERTVQGFSGNYQGKYWEVDAFATNDEVAIIGEVKLTLNKEAIDKFINGNLSRFHLYYPEHHGHKKIYGVIAFVQVARKDNEEELIEYAHQLGLLVVKAIDDTFRLFSPVGHKLRDYGVSSD